jgi:hypothetical protein
VLRAHLLCGREQGRRIQVENGLRIRLVPELRVVAAQRENIAYAERGGAEELGLQRDAVAVATGDLQNGFDAASHQEVRRRQAGHVGLRSRAVGHIDRGDEPAQCERVIDEFGGIGGHRRGKLGGDDETSVPQVPLELADGATR